MAYTSIDKPSDYFNTKLYTGNGTNATGITGVGFQPDWVWCKQRSGADNHVTSDAVRGGNKQIYVNLIDAETSSTSMLQSFNSDGFTLGTDGAVNQNSATYASWNWKAGTSFSNSAGANSATIASTGSINTDAGFSIISYTGNGASNDTAKIAHGLGAVPNMIVVKSVNAQGGWQMSNTPIGWNNVLQFNEGSGQATGTYAFGVSGVTPTSTVFTVAATSGGNHTNTNSNTYIAYCFAEKKGYSKFGTYTGNGSDDGPFIYTGLKPAFIIVKKYNTSENWLMADNKINPFNFADGFFACQNTNAESNMNIATGLDLLSNGIKMRDSDGTINSSGGQYFFMAFAENPFVTSTGIPACAR